MNIRLLYLYLFSFIGLVTVVMSSVRLVDLGLKVSFFQEADKYEYYSQPVGPDEVIDKEKAQISAQVEQTRSRQRELSNSLSMLLIGAPLYIYHWNLIKKEGKKENN